MISKKKVAVAMRERERNYLWWGFPFWGMLRREGRTDRKEVMKETTPYVGWRPQ
jgi:hypothetical protein